MGDTIETQAKMTKTLDQLVKANSEKASTTTKPSKPPPTSIAATLRLLQNDANKINEKPETQVEETPEDVSDLLERQKVESGFVEMRWAQNLLLIGDGLWFVVIFTLACTFKILTFTT